MTFFSIVCVFLALYFSALFLKRFKKLKEGEKGQIACLIAFFMWASYAAYEAIYISYWMLTVRGAPIRIDIILFIPVLIVVTVVALVRSAPPEKKGSKPFPLIDD